MAEVLSQKSILLPCGGGGSMSKKNSVSSALPGGYLPGIESLSLSSLSSGFRDSRLLVDAPRGKLEQGHLTAIPVQILDDLRSGFENPALLVSVSAQKVVATSILILGEKRMTPTIRKSLKWWEKGLQPNMKEIESAQDLVDSLLNAGDKLVIVDFFSPRCGGCRTFHPKICQFAEMNPDVQFLQIDNEKHKSICYSLNIHVLPFFRFYRGANGRLCSFSCTNATIKKFRDALTKHNTARCSLGPVKGLEESELLDLAANKDLSFNYSKKSLVPSPDNVEEKAPAIPTSLVPTSIRSIHDCEDKTLVIAGR